MATSEREKELIEDFSGAPVLEELSDKWGADGFARIDSNGKTAHLNQEAVYRDNNLIGKVEVV